MCIRKFNKYEGTLIGSKMEEFGMSNWKNEAEAREEIKKLVAEYYHDFKEPVESKKNFKPGDRVSYAKKICRVDWS